MPATSPSRSATARGEESERRNLIILLSVVPAYAVAGVALLIYASHLHGLLRYVLGTVGVIGVSFLALWAGAGLAFGLGWGFFTATFRENPSTLQRVGWVSAAIVVGALLGSSTYAAGPGGSLSGPLLLVAIVAALRIHPFDRDFVSRRIIWFVTIAAAVSIPVGLTIFL